MQALQSAIDRLDKRARDPRAIAFGLATDLEVIANALREVANELSRVRHMQPTQGEVGDGKA